MILKDLFTLLIVVLCGFVYYKFSTSEYEQHRRGAFYGKIYLLILSFILVFIRQDSIYIGKIFLGGRTSVMLIALIEIVDAFVDRKRDN